MFNEIIRYFQQSLRKAFCLALGASLVLTSVPADALLRSMAALPPADSRLYASLFEGQALAGRSAGVVSGVLGSLPKLVVVGTVLAAKAHASGNDVEKFFSPDAFRSLTGFALEYLQVGIVCFVFDSFVFGLRYLEEKGGVRFRPAWPRWLHGAWLAEPLYRWREFWRPAWVKALVTAVLVVPPMVRLYPVAVDLMKSMGWPAITWPHLDFRNDILGLGVRLMMLEGLTLAAASVGMFYPRDQTAPRMWERLVRPGLIPYYVFLAMPVVYFLSMGWSLSGFLASSPILFMVFFAALFVMYPLWYPPMARRIPIQSRRDMAKNSLVAGAIAFPLLFLMVPAHIFGHSVGFNLNFVTTDATEKYPHGLLEWLSLFAGEYVPPLSPHRAPYFAAWRTLSDGAAQLWYMAAGPIATTLFAFALYAVSFFVKAKSHLQRGFRLAALLASFMGLQYVRGSAVTGHETDWTILWRDASPGLKHLLTLVGFLPSYIIAVARAIADRKEWIHLSAVEKDLAANGQSPASRLSFVHRGFDRGLEVLNVYVQRIAPDWRAKLSGVNLRKLFLILNLAASAVIVVAASIIRFNVRLPAVEIAQSGVVLVFLAALVTVVQDWQLSWANAEGRSVAAPTESTGPGDPKRYPNSLTYGLLRWATTTRWEPRGLFESPIRWARGLREDQVKSYGLWGGALEWWTLTLGISVAISSKLGLVAPSFLIISLVFLAGARYLAHARREIYGTSLRPRPRNLRRIYTHPIMALAETTLILGGLLGWVRRITSVPASEELIYSVLGLVIVTGIIAYRVSTPIDRLAGIPPQKNVSPLVRRIQKWYFAPRVIEMDGLLYEWMGMRFFQLVARKASRRIYIEHLPRILRQMLPRRMLGTSPNKQPARRGRNRRRQRASTERFWPGRSEAMEESLNLAKRDEIRRGFMFLMAVELAMYLSLTKLWNDLLGFAVFASFFYEAFQYLMRRYIRVRLQGVLRERSRRAA